MKRVVVGIVLAMAVAGCSTPLSTREKGALAGGAIGAGTGALIGSQVGHTGTGALVGAGIGAVSGAVIGDAIQGAEQKAQRSAPAASPPTAPPPPPVAVAAPPPVVVKGKPRLIWVPQWGVYLLEGYDVVQYDGVYYYFHGGHWWVAQSYAGPWAVVASPPPGIAKLPRGHLHAKRPGRGTGGCPPGLAKQGRC